MMNVCMNGGMDSWMDRNVNTNINLFCKESDFSFITDVISNTI
jgi:hypothetical protein